MSYPVIQIKKKLYEELCKESSPNWDYPITLGIRVTGVIFYPEKKDKNPRPKERPDINRHPYLLDIARLNPNRNRFHITKTEAFTAYEKRKLCTIEII